jgi:hypothetical protein
MNKHIFIVVSCDTASKLDFFNEWMNECMNEWMNEWMNEQIVIVVSCDAASKLDFFNEWTNEWMSKLSSSWHVMRHPSSIFSMNERMNEWANCHRRGMWCCIQARIFRPAQSTRDPKSKFPPRESSSGSCRPAIAIRAKEIRFPALTENMNRNFNIKHLVTTPLRSVFTLWTLLKFNLEINLNPRGAVGP